MSQVAQMLKEIFKRIERGKIGTLYACFLKFCYYQALKTSKIMQCFSTFPGILEFIRRVTLYSYTYGKYNINKKKIVSDIFII